VLNLDVLAFVGAAAGLAAVLAMLWRLVRGGAKTRLWAGLRVAGAAGLALVLVAAGAYWLMDSRTVQVSGTLVSRGSAAPQKSVALTFDDGPAGAYVDEIIAVLDEYHAKGTFFVVGEVAQKQPAALRKLVAAGEQIGNHSYTHPRLVGVSVGRVADEVERADAVIRAAGYGGEIFFRPPYCKKLVSEPYYLATHHRTSVTWDLEPDSIGSLADDPQAMATYVADNVRPGSIVLLHPWGEYGDASRRALPLILEALAAKGYSFTTVSGLLASR
jgi:peptidoglycan-N-acetylglucosamine deacetylase